jgi:hypothetical protein
MRHSYQAKVVVVSFLTSNMFILLGDSRQVSSYRICRKSIVAPVHHVESYDVGFVDKSASARFMPPNPDSGIYPLGVLPGLDGGDFDAASVAARFKSGQTLRLLAHRKMRLDLGNLPPATNSHSELEIVSLGGDSPTEGMTGTIHLTDPAQAWRTGEKTGIAAIDVAANDYPMGSLPAYDTPKQASPYYFSRQHREGSPSPLGLMSMGLRINKSEYTPRSGRTSRGHIVFERNDRTWDLKDII